MVHDSVDPVSQSSAIAATDTWSDSSTNNVVLSRTFAARFWDVATRLTSCFLAHDIHRHVVGSPNIWIRDYYPVQVGNHFVQFRYAASYDGGRARNDLAIGDEFTFDFGPVKKSRIVLDGAGNCVRYGDRAIVSDVVFARNRCHTARDRTLLLTHLEKELCAEVIVVPCEPGDEMGHADGIVRWIDAGTVLINDYSVMPYKKYRTYESKLVAQLTKSGLRIERMPFAYHRSPMFRESEFRRRYPVADGFNPGLGYYINFLQMKNLIAIPTFNIDEDEAAANTIRAHFPTADIRTINCAQLSMYGGLLNCVTATFRTPELRT